MKSENSINNGECVIIGNTQMKNVEKISSDIIIRNPKNGRILSIKKLTTDEFLEKARKIHGELYNYSQVNYVDSRTPIIIICPIHGEFFQNPTCHINQKQGCPKCGYERTHNSTKLTQTQWEQKANIKHDNKYNYLKAIYVRGRQHVTIICPEHGEFQQTPEAHLQGRGCPQCNFSKAEQKIEKWLKDNNIHYITQQTFNDCKNPKTNCKLRFDFYIPSKKLLIEFDGKQHYQEMITGKYIITKEKLENNKFRDNIKTTYAINKNIKLLRIAYTEFNQIENILTTNL